MENVHNSKKSGNVAVRSKKFVDNTLQFIGETIKRGLDTIIGLFNQVMSLFNQVMSLFLLIAFLGITLFLFDRLFSNFLKNAYSIWHQGLLVGLIVSLLVLEFDAIGYYLPKDKLKLKNWFYVKLAIFLILVISGFALNRFFGEYTSKFPLEFKSLTDIKVGTVSCWSVSKYSDVTTEDTILCDGRFNNTYPFVLDIRNVTIEHGSYSSWINTNTRHNITTTCNQGSVNILPNNTGICTFKFWFEDLGLNNVDVSFTPGVIHTEELENGTGRFTPNSKYTHVTFNSVEGVFTNATYGDSIDLRIENPVEVLTSDKVEERRNTRLTGFFISVAAIIFSVLSGVQNLKSIIRD